MREGRAYRAKQLKAIQGDVAAGRYGSSLAALDAILAGDGENLDALYMAAVCHRCLCQFEQAMERLRQIKALAPDHSRAYQEEGHLHRDAGNADRALVAYVRATRLNPALVAAWREQRRLLRQTDRREELARVSRELDRIESLPKPLVVAIDLIAQGRLIDGEEIVRQFLKTNPRHVEAMRLLADIGIRLGVLDDAEFLLEAAVRFEPGNEAARIDYITALRKRQKFAEALEESRTLLQRDPGNVHYRSIHAVCCMQSGAYDVAISEFDTVLERVPGDPVTLTARGHALKTSGRYEEAVQSYELALERQSHYGEAWYSLANLKVYQFDADDLEALFDLQHDENLPHTDRIYISFALGKAAEDRGDLDAAFASYEKGNALKKVQSRYDADAMSADLATQRKVCDGALFRDYEGAGCDAPDPIFIVGLPRAGSTLLEQILASHSQVDGTMELPNVLTLVQRLRRPARSRKQNAYPDVLRELSRDELRELGETYIRETRVHRDRAPFFIDKMPNNFRHIGLIRLMLPNATIIDARRKPMACCFSAFRQLFAEGQEFSYDLRDLGRYYRDYVRLMDHWDTVLPGYVLRVGYEDTVEDLESSVRRVLKHCGLPFEAACLEFYRTRRNVRTPSSEQVRKPIYRSGLEAWKRFEHRLKPLKQALGEDVRRRYEIH